MATDLDFTQLLAMVKELLAERFGIAPERMHDTVYIRDLGLDSMLMLDVMLEMEDRLGIKLTNLAMPPNPPLRDVVAIIERNLQASG